MMKPADLIVVGAGSAGCVLASRLARDFGIRLALLEPPSLQSANINRLRPSRWLHQLGSSDDWGFSTQPSPNLAARSINWPRGRGLGGSSRINAMIWFPPTCKDIDRLCKAGGEQWTRSELEAAYRSVELLVRPEKPRWLSRSGNDFLEASLGFRDTQPMLYDRLCHNGRRWLPRELLPEESERFQIVRGFAEKLIWKNDKVVGVQVWKPEGTFELRSSMGVVLTAGAIATPTILMRSGVGNREELGSHGIDQRLNCEAIGRNLRDHLIMPVVFERTQSQQAFLAQPITQDLSRWQVMGSGPISSNLAECGGLIEDQSLQFHVTPTNYLTYPKRDHVPSMTIGVNVTQPRSQGELHLTSTHPQHGPEIQPRYLDDAKDLQDTIRGVRLARMIAERSPLAATICREIIPGGKRSDDLEIARSTARFAQTLYHPIGTCRIGQDQDAAIDHHFSVRGSDQLWIVDGSILTELTTGNPNATIMMLAWWAAERIANRL